MKYLICMYALQMQNREHDMWFGQDLHAQQKRLGYIGPMIISMKDHIR